MTKTHETNEMRLAKCKSAQPLVGVGETIVVMGAGGQIGHKLKPQLEKLYPGQVLYTDRDDFDVTDAGAVQDFLKTNHVKVIINLAALLSAAAEKNPEAARQVNLLAPMTLMEAAKRSGVRKLQMMSSIASQEYDYVRGELPQVSDSKRALQNLAPEGIICVPKGSYGQQKAILELTANHYATHHDVDVSVPRLAGVLNCHTPWPSDGTTEELDKMIVAAAEQAVYGTDAPHSKNGVYKPQVPAAAIFCMIDGDSLAESVLLLLHQDARKSGAVHNVAEYSVEMGDAAKILGRLNPDFRVEFPRDVASGLDAGKTHRSEIWPEHMDTASTEKLIGNFKQYTAESSIRANYTRVLETLKHERFANVKRPAGDVTQGAA